MLLADHLERGGERARAGAWYLGAASRALAASELDAAIDRAERGASCVGEGELLGALRLVQAEARFWKGDHPEAERLALVSAALLPSGGNDWLRAAFVLAESGARLHKKDALVALAHDLVGRDGAADGPTQLVMIRCAATLRLHEGHSALAEALIARLGVPADAVVAGELNRAQAMLDERDGRYGDALEHIRLAADAYEQSGNLRGICQLRFSSGSLLSAVGLFAEAERELRGAAELAAELGLAALHASAENNLGLCLTYQDRLDDAIALHERAKKVFAASGDARTLSFAHGGLTMAHLRRGALDAALVESLAQIAIAPTSPSQAVGLAIHTQVRLARGELPEALEASARARALLGSAEAAEGFELMVLVARAEALHASGGEDEARAELAEALRRMRTSASGIVDADLRAAFLEKMPEPRRIAELARLWKIDPSR
jgi:tetratricopeptide (TPR) repeat protein